MESHGWEISLIVLSFRPKAAWHSFHLVSISNIESVEASFTHQIILIYINWFDEDGLIVLRLR